MRPLSRTAGPTQCPVVSPSLRRHAGRFRFARTAAGPRYHRLSVRIFGDEPAPSGEVTKPLQPYAPKLFLLADRSVEVRSVEFDPLPFPDSSLLPWCRLFLAEPLAFPIGNAEVLRDVRHVASAGLPMSLGAGRGSASSGRQGVKPTEAYYTHTRPGVRGPQLRFARTAAGGMVRPRELDGLEKRRIVRLGDYPRLAS